MGAPITNAARKHAARLAAERESSGGEPVIVRPKKAAPKRKVKVKK